MLHETIRLGRVRGIQLGAHWSVVVIGWLLVWALADVTLPELAPGSSDLTYWAVAVVLVVLFWAALLAHEVAHSLVAIRLGVEVEGITLWLFGGVSRLHGEAATPDDELRIAIAGPATSLGIAVVAGALAAGSAALGGPDLLVAALGWLGAINLMLALFNLIPAAPLDGGRVLHALVWRRSGDRSQATITATNAGRTFGYVLIGLGVLLVAAGDIGGVWFVFLGWFLLAAARAEQTHVLVHDALAGVRVRDVMTADLVTAPADVSVAELLEEHVLRHHCSAFPLTDTSGALVAFITLRQIKAVPAPARASVTAREAGVPIEEVPRAAPGDPVLDLLDRIEAGRAGDGRALVFDGDRAVGIVSPTDLNRAVELARLRGSRPEAPTPR
jgi:Zn-dependent protease/CBS domain-containing protein